jgi:serine/threonine-protein kinase
MLDQAERYPSVGALREAVERFLDGDRNMELRRDLAAEHAARAEAAAFAALAGDGSSGEQARRTALREVGRALALDPDNERALAALEKVFTAPPREVPAEVTERLHAAESQRYRLQIGDAIVADLVGMACAFPFVLWMGVREWSFVIAVVALTALSIAFKVLAYRKVDEPIVEVHAYLAFLFNLLAVAAIARAWGPLFVMPVLLLVFANGYAAASSVGHRWRVLLTTLAVQLGAVLVEVLGLVPRSYAFADGALTILPRGVAHSEAPTLVGLTVFSLFMIFMPMRMSGRLQAVLREAEQRAMVNAWQLGQLLPNKARTTPPPAG